ncbi:hypothetical protein CHCC14813_2149 [Bacillus licheniformis]|nr:hypothetical protein CHCC14813_2149 [Bacillus licheniformis]
MTRRDEIIEYIQHLHVEIDGLLEEIRELEEELEALEEDE